MSINNDTSVKVFMQRFGKTLIYQEQPMLTYEGQYPQFASRRFRNTLCKLNRYYKGVARGFQRDMHQDLYPAAVEQYKESQIDDFPFRSFEAMLDFTITYNKDFLLSLYYDRYAYTGGAHGSTVRVSDVWNLYTGQKVLLSDVFSCVDDYRDYILAQILQQISYQISAGAGQYFENHRELADDKLEEANFFLTKDGAVIYFQQYDIAPYSSGIVTFLIPYVCS